MDRNWPSFVLRIMFSLNFSSKLENKIYNFLILETKTGVHLCGSESTCNCSKSTIPGVVSIDDCPMKGKGVFLMSKIKASKVAIKNFYDRHIANFPTNDLSNLGIIISDTWIVEIIDLKRNQLLPERINYLEFQNNPNLTLGSKDASASFVALNWTVFRQHGVSKLHDILFVSRNVMFANFSDTFVGLAEQIYRPKTKPWSGIAGNNLFLEGSLLDLPQFLGFDMETVTIRNAVSINDVELVPQYFLQNVTLLKKLSIFNSYHVTLPKFYFDNLYNPEEKDHNLSIKLDIWNVQQNSIGRREKIISLKKLNHVIVNNEMRNILALYNDPLLCASFCQTNDGTKLNCFELSDDEKRACGICVKNIVGLDNLDEKLQQVCYIVNTSSTSPETTVSQNENPVSTKGSMPATSTNTTISQFLSTNHVTDVKPTYTTFETSKFY